MYVWIWLKPKQKGEEEDKKKSWMCVPLQNNKILLWIHPKTTTLHKQPTYSDIKSNLISTR